MSHKPCYLHDFSPKPHPLCGCGSCNTNRKLHVKQTIVSCINCKCKGDFTKIKSGHPNQCGECGHKFTKHYCF